MPRKPRARVFMFDPDLFLSDPAVRRMTLAALGAYVRLLCEAWRSHDPGILEGDDDTIRRLASVDSADWPTLRPQVAAAFDVDSKPGIWIQKRLRDTYRSQSRMIHSRKVSGKLGAKARWGSPIQPTLQPPATTDDEWQRHSKAIATPLANDSGSMVLGSKTLASKGALAPVSKSLDSSIAIPAESIENRSPTLSRPKNPHTERQALDLDTFLASHQVSTENRRILLAHFRSNADAIRTPQAYYRPGTPAFEQLLRDLCAKFERSQLGGSTYGS